MPITPKVTTVRVKKLFIIVSSFSEIGNLNLKLNTNLKQNNVFLILRQKSLDQLDA